MSVVAHLPSPYPRRGIPRDSPSHLRCPDEPTPLPPQTPVCVCVGGGGEGYSVHL